MSIEMNITEWSTLTVAEREVWLEQQSAKDLTALLIMVGEMLEQTDDMDTELAQLIDPSDDVINARNFTVSTLRDFEKHLAVAIGKKREKLFERAV